MITYTHDGHTDILHSASNRWRRHRRTCLSSDMTYHVVSVGLTFDACHCISDQSSVSKKAQITFSLV